MNQLARLDEQNTTTRDTVLKLERTDDATYSFAQADRPELLEPKQLAVRAIEKLEGQPGSSGLQLQVEGRRLDGLLLIAGEPGEGIGEG